jgi:predicted phosphoadenosine phosphosulfate sulfurtransferase
MNITVNILEIASELAHQRLEAYFNYNQEKIYKWVSEDVSIYTEEAQDIFNQFYDEFYDLFWDLKEE